MAPSHLLSWFLSLGTVPTMAEGERQQCRASREGQPFRAHCSRWSGLALSQRNPGAALGKAPWDAPSCPASPLPGPQPFGAFGPPALGRPPHTRSLTSHTLPNITPRRAGQ